MSSYKPISTLVVRKEKLSGLSGNPYHDPFECRSLVIKLQYLTLTRPDTSYVVQLVCLFMHYPRTQDMTSLKQTIWYIMGTITQGLHISPSSVDRLTTYIDVDHIY